MKLFDPVTLTKAALVLCAQLGLSPCDDKDLTWRWIDAGGFCGQYSCNFSTGCPNDAAGSCSSDDPKFECVMIYEYPTIGSIEKFKADDTLDGPGGKHYLCRPRPPTS
jgi:hypothetical protein